ncbi:hypothetical protein GGI25_000868 [Coemansia spiralis]|uniref:glutathione gamma-glutamylcysteinyltransferase n=2 Tax=Coemansia TaxID=4863 RepID=A0A9W8L0P3_9FUNG|nr:hypothetical protein EDC05_001765 [Coemansia umbellata]KAJ2623605.1 hypothetical protein GGI26_002243 [Coemansia sp. RSA 1358]KAJ2680275.1 hypothetical protein GGI25_000868 [Coemansia spiralis]
MADLASSPSDLPLFCLELSQEPCCSTGSRTEEGAAFGPSERVKQKMISLCKLSGSAAHGQSILAASCKSGTNASKPMEPQFLNSKDATTAAVSPVPGTSFHGRTLPSSLASFTSAEGRKLFKESLNSGYAEGYFNLAGNFTVQSEPAYCGPSSLAMVLNALEVDPGRTWKGVWRWYSDELLESCRTESELKANGITFDQFLCLAGSHAQVVVKRGEAATREEFLRDIKYVTQRDDVYMVLSFSRSALGQTGDGHFSPIGAYHPGSNQALVLDTARYKYPPWFGDVDKLYDSLQPADRETGLPRGYFLISRKNAQLDSSLFENTQHSVLVATDNNVVELPGRPLDVLPTKISCGKGNTCCSSK